MKIKINNEKTIDYPRMKRERANVTNGEKEMDHS